MNAQTNCKHLKTEVIVLYRFPLQIPVIRLQRLCLCVFSQL